MKEDIRTEFKQEYTDEIKKTVIAFANTEGGTLYIGIKNDGTFCGVDNSDETLLKITNALRDNIRPDVLALTDCSCVKKEGFKLIEIRVQRGAKRPYYLASKGLRPEGVYIRHGASSIPASESDILKMVKETSPSFEGERSLNQNLTFTATEAYFKTKGLEFGTAQKKTLKLMDEDNTYTVLALLLSDQCPYTIKIAQFQGTEKNIFRDRREITGSLLSQIEETYDYVNRFNSLKAEFKGLERIDTFDYPQEAIREVLLNSLVHRDYSFSGPILISIFDDRMEFVSLGGLVKGLKKEDIFLGVSQPRNPNLANVFYRLKLIEAYGTGILKIKEAYKKSKIAPLFEITDNAFKITLPNIHFKTTEQAASDKLNKTEQQVLILFEKEKKLSRKEIETRLNVSQATAGNIVRTLQQRGLVEAVGSGRNRVYQKADASKNG